MSQFSEYTRLRDIVVKRLKRRGVTDFHVPTVKEIKLSGNANAINIELAHQTGQLQSFIYKTDIIREEKKARTPKLSPEQKRARRREYEKQYRRTKVAKQYERPEFPNKYQGYLKGLRTMGVDIPPSKLPEFFKYMDYRFAQGNAAKKYVFDIFVDDYQRMLQQGYKPDQILADFQTFEADQIALKSRSDGMEGLTLKEAINMWDSYVNLKRMYRDGY